MASDVPSWAIVWARRALEATGGPPGLGFVALMAAGVLALAWLERWSEAGILLLAVFVWMQIQINQRLREDAARREQREEAWRQWERLRRQADREADTAREVRQSIAAVLDPAAPPLADAILIHALERLPEAMCMPVREPDPAWPSDSPEVASPALSMRHPNLAPLARALLAFAKDDPSRRDPRGRQRSGAVSTAIVRALHRLGPAEPGGASLWERAMRAGAGLGDEGPLPPPRPEACPGHDPSRWQGLDLTHLDAAAGAGLHLQGAWLARARLRGMVLHRACLRGALLWEADLRGADLAHADLQGADFRKASLHGTRAFGACCLAAHFVSASCLGADFTGALLHGADFSWCDLRGASFHGAKCSPSQRFGFLAPAASFLNHLNRVVHLLAPRDDALAGEAPGPRLPGASFHRCQVGDCVVLSEPLPGLEEIAWPDEAAALADLERAGLDLDDGDARLDSRRTSFKAAALKNAYVDEDAFENLAAVSVTFAEKRGLVRTGHGEYLRRQGWKLPASFEPEGPPL